MMYKGNDGIIGRMQALEESDVGRKINLYYYIIAGKIVSFFKKIVFRKQA